MILMTLRGHSAQACMTVGLCLVSGTSYLVSPSGNICNVGGGGNCAVAWYPMLCCDWEQKFVCVCPSNLSNKPKNGYILMNSNRLTMDVADVVAMAWAERYSTWFHSCNLRNSLQAFRDKVHFNIIYCFFCSRAMKLLIFDVNTGVETLEQFSLHDSHSAQ